MHRPAAWTFGILVGLALLPACSSGGGEGSTDATKPPVAAPPEAEVPAVDDTGEPTAAARAALEALRSGPVDGEDCGSIAADSGWPTTIGVGPESADCLIGALRSGLPARQAFTGRTGDGGALLTVYEVAPDATVTVTRHVASIDGEVSSSETTCAPPTTSWIIGIDGRIQELSGDVFCQPAGG